MMFPIRPFASWLGRLPLLAALAWAGEASAQQTITKTISNSPDLIAAFAEADRNPANTYVIYLTWRKDANGNTVLWKPQSTVTLTKGKVQVYGSNTHLYPERYTFDGEQTRAVFAVNAAAGYQPTLLLSGITVQNGWSKNFGGGGLWANNAWDIQIYYCIFQWNKSNQPGSGIFLQTVHNAYLLHTSVIGNENDQISGCLGGQTAGGGGIGVLGGPNLTYFSMHNSSVVGNKACRGGGIQINGQVSLNMHNNTISDNEAVREGGGMILQGDNQTSYFYHNTLTGNLAGNTNDLIAAEINAGGGVVFQNFNGNGYWDGNVFAKNTVKLQTFSISYNTEDCYVSAGGPTFSAYTNVVGRISNCSQLGTGGSWGVGTDRSPFDPKLGSVFTAPSTEGFAQVVHIPNVDSPLRGNYFNPGFAGYNCPSTDERGLPRKSNGCDIGAAERQSDASP